MAVQVGKLILETGIKGFEEVQELGKGLKQIAKKILRKGSIKSL